MPFYLKRRDIWSEARTVNSALIVPCRFCPAASFAVSEKQPYIEFFRHGLKTPAYEAYIREVRTRLGSIGIKTELFASRLPHQFIVCMWTSARRKELVQHAVRHDAVIVLGCDAAVDAIRSSVASTGCRVIAGMAVEGLMNVVPTVRFPFNVWLQVSSMTRLRKEP